MTATEPKRRGAKVGNAHRLTHGLRASKLPRDAKGEEKAGYALRTLLMVALEAVHGIGRVPPAAQALVQTAHRHEIRARLAARWLRLECDKAAKPDGKPLSLADRLMLTEAISNASEARDKVIRQLGLAVTGKSTGGLWDEFDASRGRPDSVPLGSSFPRPREALDLLMPGDTPDAICPNHPAGQTATSQFPQNDRDANGTGEGPQPKAEGEAA